MLPVTVIFFVACLVVSVFGDVPNQVTVNNHVAPCPGDNYPTIKTFPANGAQQNLNQGQSATYDAGAVSTYVGFGMQENGLYCRDGGGAAGCINPDNAGLQVVWNGADCNAISINGPFYCGHNPPDARRVINVAPSGNWPHCVLTLTRKGDAPGCQYNC